ncbi:SH3 domain-containing protein [Macromonas bipunctata]|uniref:SH3 domain-containing protein n=1 Tax=Macromonas bipunctata TaxID=183670 RepID=UPI000C3248B1|nr:SH3 domain-containing protein [Macromonas bipunctata]
MRLLPRFTFSLLLLAGLATTSHAQELVSVKTQGANLRQTAGTQAEVQWQLARGYPLQVLQREGGWLKVQDFEGDQGWVAAAVTQPAPHHVVRVRSANLRQGPGTEFPVVGYAVYGQVLATEHRGEAWVRVRSRDGQSAWVARDLLWGW